MKLEHNCVIFDVGDGYQSFHVMDIKTIRHHSYKANGDLGHCIILTREGNQHGHEFIVSSETSYEQIAQFVDSVYKARRDFNYQHNLLPTH